MDKINSIKTLDTPIVILFFSFIWIVITGCQTMSTIQTVENVDIKRFMGDWYVIANIPTLIEKKAFNAIESYRLDSDDTVITTFSFNKGSLDGPLKTYTFRGFVQDKTSQAVWGMQFIWPFRAEYRIIYLNEDYSQTVIGRTKRDYVWIMARKPTMSDDTYESILNLLKDRGYDINKIRKIRHSSRNGGS